MILNTYLGVEDMESDIKFKTLKELYMRLKPALRSKVKELHKKGYHYIHEEDVWNFLKNYKWTSARDLDLGVMVNDIFGVNDEELNEYTKEEIRKYHREVNEEE